MIEIRSKDGNVFRFPEGTDDATISAAIQRFYADRGQEIPTPRRADSGDQQQGGNRRENRQAQRDAIAEAANDRQSRPPSGGRGRKPARQAQRDAIAAAANAGGGPRKPSGGAIRRESREAQWNAIRQAQIDDPRRSFSAAVYDNLIGDPNDGVQSMGESLGTWLNRAGESATFGLVGDEASAAVTGMLPGRSYESELERYRQNEENMSPAAQFTADIAGAFAPGAVGVKAVKGAATMGGKIARGLGFGAAAGGTTAFMEGEGDFRQRAGNVPMGAAIGGAFGGAAVPIGAGVTALGKGMASAAQSTRAGRAISERLGVGEGAGRVLGRMVADEDPGDLRRALSDAGPQGMLADTSGEMAGMLDMAMRNASRRAGVARERIDERAGQSQYGVLDAMRGGRQGPGLPPVTNQRNIRETRRPVVNPLYNAAYGRQVDYSTDAGRAVEDIVLRIPGRIAESAIRKANEKMIYKGFPRQQIMARIGDDGTVSYQEMPNTMQLDYIKRGLDDIVRENRDPVTKELTPDGEFASLMARELREAVGDAVPEYRTALAEAATTARARDAVAFGQDVLRQETRLESVINEVNGMTPAELRYLREGLMGEVDHILGNVRAIASDPNVDARQTREILSRLSSPNAKRKLQAVFGDEIDQIESQMKEVETALALRAEVAGNSRTQPRTAAERVVDEELDPGLIRSLEGLNAVRTLARRMVGSDPETVAELKREARAELADILTRQGPEADAVLRAVQDALANTPARQTGELAGDVVTGIGVGYVPGLVDYLDQSLGD